MNVLSYGATAAAVSVLVAMWIRKDVIVAATPRPVATWARHRWLRLRGLEEYVGRHRYDYSNTVAA